MGNHSIIPPSLASRRRQCNGSAIMELMYPQTTEADDAKKGTASHELAPPMIYANAKGGLGFPLASSIVGATASNGVIWTQDSYDGAKLYADDVGKVMRETGVFTPIVEQTVNCWCIHPESFGTPDCWLFDPVTRTLYIWDYKYGHRVVEVEWNSQLIEYFSGILDVLEQHHGDRASDLTMTVVFTIVQPRAYHRNGTIRRWRVPASDLRGEVNKLSAVEHAALSDNPTTCAGPECLDCSARNNCETLQQATTAVVKFTGVPSPINLTADQLAVELQIVSDAYDILEARLKGLRAQAEGIIQSGNTVRGWACEQGYGRDAWSVPADQLFIMGDLSGINLRKDAPPVTPKQAIALGMDEQTVKSLSYRPRTSVKLVQSSTTLASKIFGKKES